MCRCASQFYGPLCQLTLRSFLGDGFASFPPIRFCSENHLSIEFISDEPVGIVLYSGPLSSPPLGNSDFSISIVIAQGVPSLKIGEIDDSLHLQLPEGVNATDGKWHRIDVRVKKKEVTFTLDRCSAAIIMEKEGVGKRLLSEDRAGCEVRGVMTKEWRIWNPHHVLRLGGMKASTPLNSTQTHFKGCLRNLIVNKEMYDLGAPIESVSSSPGCTACDTVPTAPCATKSPCTGEFGVSGSSQQECDKDATEYFFQSGSFIQYKFPHAFHRQRTYFQTMVRTRQSNSIILSVSSQDQTEYIILQVTHGMLAVSYNIGDGDFVVRLPNHRIDSGEWQEVTLDRMQNEFSLRVNGGGEHREITAAHGTYKEIKVDPSSIVLGSGNLQALSFQGCIKDARLNNYKLPMDNQSSTAVTIIRKHGVNKGCVSDMCKSQPCDRGFVCTDLWMIHECSCPPGYLLTENNTGQWCLYTVCLQSPCKRGTCIPQTPAEFTCLCPHRYGGSKCDVLLHGLDPGLGLSTFLIICICSTALIALIAGAVLFSHCNKKRRLNEGVYHVSAYKDEPEDTRQNIFHYNEEGGGEEDQDAFSMTDLQLSLQSSPAQSLCRRMREQHINGPLSCYYDTSDSQKVTSQVPAPKRLSCSFTGGDFEQYFYDVCQDAAYMRASCDSLKVYDTEGTGSLAGSLSTLASSGLDSDLEYEEVRTWGPKFSYLCKLYSYTEDDDP
ncbi:Cadherin cytoplasmic region [Pristimantis euphronides]